MVTYRFGDVVVVRFPFTDIDIVKPRPAVVISSAGYNSANEHTIVAMITTGARSSWASDIEIFDLDAAGLRHRSVVRWKVATLLSASIAVRIGEFVGRDRDALASAAKSLLGP